MEIFLTREEYLGELKRIGGEIFYIRQETNQKEQMKMQIVLQQEIALFEHKVIQARKENLFLPFEYLLNLTGCNKMEAWFLRFLLAEKMLQLTEGWDGRGILINILSYSGSLSEEWKALYTFWNNDELVEFYMDSEKQLELEERILYFAFYGTKAYKPYASIFTCYFPTDNGYDVSQIVELIKKTIDSGQKTCVYLSGEEYAEKEQYASSICQVFKENCGIIDLDELAEEKSLELFRRILRECRIYQVIPILKINMELWSQKEAEHLLEIVSEYYFLFFLCSKVYLSLFIKNLVVFPIERKALTMQEREEVWRKEMAGYVLAENNDIKELAGKFLFYPIQIRQALREAWQCALVKGEEVISRQALMEGCYRVLEPMTEKKAIPVELFYQWDDLVLPPYQKELLRSACAQVRYKRQVFEAYGMGKKFAYGKGTSVVFSGPPGTGKTMAAQVMAGEIGMKLYKIELTSVVSKFIGETEKNLMQIFEMAKKSQIILFFDEADVLFSKRTEVKDSNDKFNNMEAAFLLQQMECYDGITILATNYIQNFDEAFKRRIKFLIEFPFPDKQQREEIWRKSIPQELPCMDLDFDFLARQFQFSGGNIKNIILHSAFLAAEEEKKMSMHHVMYAIRNEYAKNGRTLTKNDAGEYYMYLEC